MAALKTLLLLVSCAIAVSAFPQGGATIEGDAETIATENTGGLPGDGIPVIIIQRRPIFLDRNDGGFFNLFPSLFTSLFNRRPAFGGNSTSNATTTGFPPFFFGSGGEAPEGDMNTNSTYDVTVKDGHRIEVNRTTGGDKDGGFFFTRVVMNIVPDEGAEGPEVPVFPGASPSEDPSVNQEVTSPPLVRRKRWSFRDYLNSLRRRKVKAKSLPTCRNSEESAENLLEDRASVLNVPAPSPRLPNPPTYVGDTNVNYMGTGPVLRDNPDAEIFDVNLVEAAADRFHSRNSPPLISGPMRSQPIVSGTVRSQPIVSGPVRSQPIMAEPLRSLRSQPALDEPLRSLRLQPAVDEPLRSLRSQPAVDEPLRSLRSHPAVDEPLRSLRSQPAVDEPLRSLRSQPAVDEPLRSLRSQPAVDEPLRSQPLNAEPLRSLRSQPALDEPLGSLRSQPTGDEPLRSQPLNAEPLRSLRSQPAVDEPLRSQPLSAETLRSLRSQPAVEELRESQPISSEASRSLRSQPVQGKPLESKSDATEPLGSRPQRLQALRALPNDVQSSKASPLQTQDSGLLFKKFLRLL